MQRPFREPIELVKTEPLKTEYRCLFSLYPKTRLPGKRERIMPGVDFNVLRTEITMEQVLNQLGFQPTSRSGSQLELWATVNKLSMYEAAIDLCRALGREVPWIQQW